MFEVTASKQNATHAIVTMYGTIQQWSEINAGRFRKLFDDLQAQGYASAVFLTHSVGGNVFEGNAIKNIIKNSSIEVEVLVEGMAASMMTVVMTGANKIKAYRNSMFMLHQPSATLKGDADTLRSQAEILDKLKEEMVNAYAEKTGKTKEWILENWLVAGKDKWLTAKEALEAGLIDEVIDKESPVKVDASASPEEVIAVYESVFSQKPTDNNSNSQTNTSKMKRENQLKILALLGVAMSSIDASATDESLQTTIEQKIAHLVAENTQLKATQNQVANAAFESLLATKKVPTKQAEAFRELAKSAGIEAVTKLVETFETPTTLSETIAQKATEKAESSTDEDVSFEAAMKASKSSV